LSLSNHFVISQTLTELCTAYGCVIAIFKQMLTFIDGNLIIDIF